MPTVMVNVEQAQAWNGAGSRHWLTHEDRYNASVSRYERRLQQAAAVAGTDRVLDVGCGCGESTRNAARAAASGTALGVDLSNLMIARARDRAAAEGFANARFEQADAQVHPFEPAGFDVVISRFGAMFFVDPLTAFRNIAAGMRPGGRLVVLSWQAFPRNEWLVRIRAALAAGRVLPDPPLGVPGPFGLADPDATRSILTTSGFAEIAVADITEAMWLGADTEDAIGFLTGLGYVRGLLDGVETEAAARAMDRLRATLSAHQTQAGILLGSAALLVTGRRS
jgi:SAM-dependent methyltransferase